MVKVAVEFAVKSSEPVATARIVTDPVVLPQVTVFQLIVAGPETTE